MAGSNSTKITVKLLIDTKSNTVLFAEAGKDFVDLVFSFLTLPIGAVAKLLVSASTSSAAAGASTAAMPHGACSSVSRLYKSVHDMGEDYFVPGADKSELLQPRAAQQDGRDLVEQLQAKFSMYTCTRRCMTVTVDAWADCPRCRRPMSAEMDLVLPSDSDESGGGGGEGYVKGGLLTYMVTDGLEVTPMSAINSVTLIKRFCVDKDVVDIAQKYVVVDMDQRLPLLMAALRSDTVLSDFFLARRTR